MDEILDQLAQVRDKARADWLRLSVPGDFPICSCNVRGEPHKPLPYCVRWATAWYLLDGSNAEQMPVALRRSQERLMEEINDI